MTGHESRLRAALEAGPVPFVIVRQSLSDTVYKPLLDISADDLRSLLDEFDALRATTGGGDSAKRFSDAPAGLGVERCGAPRAGWVSVEDRMPEAGTQCLVWSRQSWEKTCSAKIDTWDEQREAPVPFSSHTIPIGLGWGEHDDFYSVTHWMPLPDAPLPDATVTQGHSHGSEQDGETR